MAKNTGMSKDSGKYIFTRHITVKGKKIYHPTGGVFRIPVEKLAQKPRR